MPEHIAESTIARIVYPLHIGGVQINYFFICKTKLWLFSHKIAFEDNSEIVKLGKLIHKFYYQKEEKDVILEDIAIDFIKKGDVLEIHEIKKSDREIEADKFQALYYLYYLKKKGIQNSVAILNYPKQGKVSKIELTEEYEKQLEEILQEIKKIISLPSPPPPVKTKRCSKCAYFYFCWG